MYEISEEWIPYFEELNPNKRWETLEELAKEHSEDAAFCRSLFRERYVDEKHPERFVDRWLWKCVYLPGIYRRHRLFVRAIQHEAEGTLSDLRLNRLDQFSEGQRAFLYGEYRNAAKRYLSTCNGAKYGSRFFGMKKASDKEKLDKACEDVWQSSRGIALATKKTEEFAIWCDALHDALLEYNPDAQEYYDELEERFEKNHPAK